jgi:hypothetical protein
MQSVFAEALGMRVCDVESRSTTLLLQREERSRNVSRPASGSCGRQPRNRGSDGRAILRAGRSAADGNTHACDDDSARWDRLIYSKAAMHDGL